MAPPSRSTCTYAATLAEARARQAELAKTRSLLFHEQLRAKRAAKIKSKLYRKVRKKQAARQHDKAAEEGGGDDDEDDAATKAAKARALERMSLRHKNTSKWARRALSRGGGGRDAATRGAIAEQLQIANELERRAESAPGDDDDDESDESDDDGTAGLNSGRRRGASHSPFLFVPFIASLPFNCLEFAPAL